MSDARNFIDNLATRGHYHFTSARARDVLGGSAASVKLALNRLTRKGLLASPARGFYVIVPPEYNRLGCLPADQFIPALMAHMNRPYYAALLSAAQYYGAAHHRPQVFQVALSGNRPPIECGAVRVSFIARKRIAEVPVQKFNTPRGEIIVSSPEATALDLVGYMDHAGGIDNVATVLAELAEHLDPERLQNAALTAPVLWSQRLGYLLEITGGGEKTEPLKAYIRENARNLTPLLPGAPHDRDTPRSRDWKILINADIEAKT